MIELLKRGLPAIAILAACALAASALPGGSDVANALAVGGFVVATYVALDRALLRGGPRIAVIRVRLDRWDGLYALAACAACAAWLVSGGVPAFRQDWYLSPLGTQFGRELWQTLSAWQPAELGSATPQAGLHPLLLAWGLVAFVSGSKFAVLAFVIAALFACGALGRRAIAALIGADGAPAVAGGFIFAFGAPTMNKLVAGHTLHLADQALLAAAILLACGCIAARGARARSIAQIGLALVIALAAPQPQGFVLCAGAAILVAIAGRSGVPLVALAGAVLLQLPTALAAVSSPGETYVVKRALIEWQYAQSAPPALLSSLGGYISRYYELGSHPFMRVAAALVTGLAIVGTVRLRGAAAAFALAGFAAAFLIMGLRGPLAAELAFIYQSFSAASLFREIYHIAPLLAFAVALGAAAALRDVIARFGIRMMLPAAIVIACACAPMFLSAAQMVPSAGDAASVRALAALSGDGRIFWLPGIYPLRTSEGRGEGYDPLMRSAGAHAVVYANQPIPMEALAYATLGSNASRALPLLERLGCTYIAIDRDAAEVRPIPGTLDPQRALQAARTFPLVPAPGTHLEIRALPPAPQIVATGVLTRTGGLDPTDPHPGDAVMLFDDPRNARALQRSAVADVAWLAFAPGTLAADPARGPVLGRYVWPTSFEYWNAPSVESVVADSARFALPAGVLVVQWRTPPALNGKAVHVQSDIALPDPAEVAFADPAAFVGERTGPAIFSRRLAARAQGKITYVRDSPTTFHGRVTGGPVHALVVRERYDTGWILEGPRSSVHFSADGWANGWIAELSDGDDFRVTYRPQRAIEIAEIVSAAGWLALLGMLAWKIAQR